MTILKDFSLFSKMKLFLFLKLILFCLQSWIKGDSVCQDADGNNSLQMKFILLGFIINTNFITCSCSILLAYETKNGCQNPEAWDSRRLIYSFSKDLLSSFSALGTGYMLGKTTVPVTSSLLLEDSGLKSWIGNHAELECFQKQKSCDLLFSLLRKIAL